MLLCSRSCAGSPQPRTMSCRLSRSISSSSSLVLLPQFILFTPLRRGPLFFDEQTESFRRCPAIGDHPVSFPLDRAAHVVPGLGRLEDRFEQQSGRKLVERELRIKERVRALFLR